MRSWERAAAHLAANEVVEVNLKDNVPTDAEFDAFLEALKQNVSVTCLLLHNTQLGDDKIRKLAPLLSRLHSVDLSSCSLGPDAGVQLADVLSDPESELVSVDLSLNHIGDRGGLAIAHSLRRAGPSRTLKWLGLRYNGITMPVAAALADNDNLQVDLAGNKVLPRQATPARVSRGIRHGINISDDDTSGPGLRPFGSRHERTKSSPPTVDRRSRKYGGHSRGHSRQSSLQPVEYLGDDGEEAIAQLRPASRASSHASLSMQGPRRSPSNGYGVNAGNAGVGAHPGSPPLGDDAASNSETNRLRELLRESVALSKRLISELASTHQELNELRGRSQARGPGSIPTNGYVHSNGYIHNGGSTFVPGSNPLPPADVGYDPVQANPGSQPFDLETTALQRELAAVKAQNQALAEHSRWANAKLTHFLDRDSVSLLEAQDLKARLYAVEEEYSLQLERYAHDVAHIQRQCLELGIHTHRYYEDQAQSRITALAHDLARTQMALDTYDLAQHNSGNVDHRLDGWRVRIQNLERDRQKPLTEVSTF